MDYTISKQDAIKAVTYGALSSATLFGRSDAGMTALRDTVRAINSLPSTQSEVIHCCECKYWKPGYITDDDDFVPPSCAAGWVSGVWRATDYCSNAERRTDGVDS